MNIRLLKNGRSGRITAVTASGGLGLRMREMGLVPGTVITVMGRAPLRDPVRLRINSNMLTLRNNEADRIEIEPVPGGDKR